MIRKIPLFLALGLVAVSVTACFGAGPEATGAACGIVVDSSGFAEVEIARKDATAVPNPGETNVATKLIRQSIGEVKSGCDTVSFAAVTGRSEGTNCRQPMVRLLPSKEENPNGNPRVADRIRKAREQEVDGHWQALLDCGDDGSRGSDVLGALRVIARELSNVSTGETRKVVVFSDMVNNVGALQLQKGDYQEASVRQDKIKALADSGLLPELGGMSVTVHGFNLVSEGDPDRATYLRLFWEELLKKSGASQVKLL